MPLGQFRARPCQPTSWTLDGGREHLPSLPGYQPVKSILANIHTQKLLFKSSPRPSRAYLSDVVHKKNCSQNSNYKKWMECSAGGRADSSQADLGVITMDFNAVMGWHQTEWGSGAVTRDPIVITAPGLGLGEGLNMRELREESSSTDLVIF